MELFADRFVVTDEGCAIDLASGRPVLLRTSSAGGAAEQLRWASRCGRFFELRHHAFARLVDYGRCGEVQRFEAWRADAPWRGVRAQARGIAESARAFLSKGALTVKDLDEHDVWTAGGRPVVVPSSDVGLQCDSAARDGVMSIARSEEREENVYAYGLALEAGGEAAAVQEEFGEVSPQPRAIALWTSDGYRLDAVLAGLSRAARVAGLVPVSMEADAARWGSLLGDRSFFLIGRSPQLDWQRLLRWTLRCPRGHVAIFAGRSEVRSVRGVALRPLSADALLNAVRPVPGNAALRSRLLAAARRASGSLETFAALVWGAPLMHDEEGTRPPARVAESVAGYGSKAAAAAGSGSPPHGREWPAPGEIVALRRKMESAVSLIESGRWAAGDRALRQTISSLARREDWARAARGATALAEALVRRGRARDALDLLDAAREHAEKAGEMDSELPGRIALVSGRVWTDVAQTGRAAAVLRTWLVPAGASELTSRGRLALARCLFWQGSYGEAREAAALADVEEASDGTRASASAMLSRSAVGLREPAAAVAAARDAVERARQAHVLPAIADAAFALAFAHLAIGDAEAVEADVSACVRAARAAHDPLRALKARLLQAESARRRGKAHAAAALLGRVKRLSGGSVPPIVRARMSLLESLLSDPSEETLRKHVAGSGLEALALFTPFGEAARMAPVAVSDALDILHCCDSAADEQAVLQELCGSLKTKLGAAAVAVFGASGSGASRIAAVAGVGRIEPEIAHRVLAVRDGVTPHQAGERVEGGMPVRYGGESVGAVVCRWTLAARVDAERCRAVLAVAAAAAGPSLAAALARQAACVSDETLLGMSAAMEEVRRAVDRAAAAPFAVLIQGESGSGKELVARALHRRGPRRARPFCTINCAALPDDLVESELFGHARGAFTGAVSERTGVFEEAHGGTLFLDEVGELSPRAQAKVLRAIQEGEIKRVGENLSRRIDVRMITATNRDLKLEVAAGRFRLDLLYRLDVIHVALPPLRDRRDDIAPLVERYWRDAAERVGSKASLAPATVAALARYDWPGNVRELQNVLSALAVRSARRGVVPPSALPEAFGPARADASCQPDASCRLDAARRTFEEHFVRAALARTGGHRGRTATELGLSRQGLTKLLSRLEIAD